MTPIRGVHDPVWQRRGVIPLGITKRFFFLFVQRNRLELHKTNELGSIISYN